ncbi:MAG TPA: hypothetical protein VHE09_14585 [Rhizomicrobium sp.]|nr:hypothetical protein [Rhizomicrobium sp.]
MAAIEPAGLITAVSDAISKLFGRPALALLLMSLVFFLLPAPWLAAIGIDQFKSGWRAAAGVALVAGAVMCFISAVPYALKPIKVLRSRIKHRKSYFAVPVRSRMALTITSVAGGTHVLAPAANEELQALVDHGLAHYVTTSNGIISAEIGIRGNDYIRRHRAKLRQELDDNLEQATALADELQKYADKFHRRR